MEETKKWWQSTTIWGGIVAVGAAVVNVLGYNISVDNQSQIVEYVTTIAGAVGGIVAIFGRVKAKIKVR